MAEQTNAALVKAGEDVAIELIRNPALAMIMSVVTIEMLQGVKVYKGRDGLIEQVGAHGYYWGHIQEPLIGQGLATTLESVIISTEALKSIGGIGSIASILKLLPLGGA